MWRCGIGDQCSRCAAGIARQIGAAHIDTVGSFGHLEWIGPTRGAGGGLIRAVVDADLNARYRRREVLGVAADDDRLGRALRALDVGAFSGGENVDKDPIDIQDDCQIGAGADTPAAVIGLGAGIVTQTRTIAADDYFEGIFTTALDEGELILAIEFPIASRAAYRKFPNPASRYAVAGVFVSDFGGGRLRVGVTGAGPCAFRLTSLEDALGRSLDPSAVEGIIIPHVATVVAFDFEV